VGTEEVLGLEGRHAAGPGRGDRLTVALVLDVAGGEDPGNAGLGRPRPGEDVALVVELELAVQEVGVRLVADREEQAGGRDVALTLCDSRNSIFGFDWARCCMIFEARSSSRRCTM
jgi:hypothetical protein